MGKAERFEDERMFAIKLWHSQYCMWKMSLFSLMQKRYIILLLSVRYAWENVHWIRKKGGIRKLSY